jgi:hypothetical protein
MAVSVFLEWLGTIVAIGGLIIGCGALIGTKFLSLARCLPPQFVAWIMFYIGIIIMLAARAL